MVQHIMRVMISLQKNIQKMSYQKEGGGLKKESELSSCMSIAEKEEGEEINEEDHEDSNKNSNQ